MANRDLRGRSLRDGSGSGSAAGPSSARVSHRKRRHNLGGPLNAGSSVNGVFSGVPGTWIDKDSEYLCPICFDTFQEAHMTKCGHSFCHQCIVRCLEQSPRCPKCNCHLDLSQASVLFPNFSLDELVAKAKQKKQDLKSRWSKACKTSPPKVTAELDQMLQAATSGNSLGLREIDEMIRVLNGKREEMSAESFLTQHTLLAEFLTHLKRLKDDQLMQLKRECDVIQTDLSKVQSILRGLSVDSDPKTESEEDQVPLMEPKPSTSRKASDSAIVPSDHRSEGFNVFRNKSSVFKSSLPQRRKRMNEHFEDLANCYFSCRSAEVAFPPEPSNVAGTSGSSNPSPVKSEEGGLEQFSSCLSRFYEVFDVASVGHVELRHGRLHDGKHRV